MSQARIVFARGFDRLELEGDVAFVDAKLAELLPLVLSPTRGSGEPSASLESKPPLVSLRAFVDERAPQNNYDVIACILAHASQFQSRAELTPEEIRACFIQARRSPPGSMRDALNDAKRRYGLIEAGSRSGRWRLSHGGEARVHVELQKSSSADDNHS